MRIGIDIDDTLVDTATSTFNVLEKYNLPKDLYFRNITNIDKQQFLFEHMDEITLGAQLKENAKEVLDELKKRGHQLIIITARDTYYSKNQVDNTYKMFKHYDVEIDEFCFGYVQKDKICQEKNIDLMIDDNIEVCESLKKIGIDYLLFDSVINKKTKLNKVYHWNGVLEYIERKEK